eukprot:Sspe_Gene.54773::Locus_30188_Transcript_1_1_Confidence_1.000_Length_4017::g.54773::m.54773/K17686/copA, ATP7; Cu+-exporting ATPase
MEPADLMDKDDGVTGQGTEEMAQEVEVKAEGEQETTEEQAPAEEVPAESAGGGVCRGCGCKEGAACPQVAQHPVLEGEEEKGVMVDLGVGEVERYQGTLVERVWPRCECTPLKGSFRGQCAVVGGTRASLDVSPIRVDTTSCVVMEMFAVEDDCVDTDYEPILSSVDVKRTAVVKPGLLAIERGDASLEKVIEALRPYHAINISKNHRILSFFPLEGPLAEPFAQSAVSGSGKGYWSHRVVIPPPPPGGTPSSLSTSPELYTTLSLPLAKLLILARPPAALPAQAATGRRYKAIVLYVPSISCGSCAAKISKALEGLDLVIGTDFFVSVPNKMVGVLTPPDQDAHSLLDRLKNVLTEKKLPPQPRHVECSVANLKIEGMTCGSCVARIRKKLQPFTATIELTDGTARVNTAHLSEQQGAEEVVAKVNSIGKFKASLVSTESILEPAPELVEVAISSFDLRSEVVLTGEENHGTPLTTPKKTPAKPPSKAPGPPSPTHGSAVFVDTLLQVRGMTCASCVSRIESHLTENPKVVSASVALATDTARVRHHPSLSVNDLCTDLGLLGYPSSELKGETAAKDLEKTISREHDKAMHFRNAMASLALSIPMMVTMLLEPHIPALEHLMMSHVVGRITVDTIFQLTLATPVVFIYGRGFFVRAAAALSHGAATMDVLVALGVGTAYLSGVLQLLFDFGEGYTDTAASLVAFMLLGKYFESLAKGKTASDLLSLLALQPSKAKLVEDGRDREVDVNVVQKGDLVKVLTGDQVPVDGEVVEGQCSVDQSMLTGESLPVPKQKGDAVAGGTTCVDGLVVIRATHVGADSTLSQILRLVNEAQTSKAPVQAFADKVASYFVPFVVGTALLSFTMWYVLGLWDVYPPSWRGKNSALTFSLNFLLATLVVACPCAMGLATPTAVMVGTGVGARVGVFIKGAETLETASMVKGVLFDKTGTLSTGKVKVVRSSRLGREDHLRLIVAAEAASQHPVAKAVVDYYKGGPLPTPTTHTTTPGKGITAVVEGHRVCIGSTKWLFSMIKDVPVSVSSEINSMNDKGLTVVAASVNGKLSWTFGLQDTLKPEAPEIIDYLLTHHYKVYMVTGDNRRAALSLARQAGLSEKNVYAEVLPGDKASIVNKVQHEVGKVAFVGDGINDAPALAAADVGIALGTGTSVAMDAADALLTKSNLRDVVAMLDLSKAVMRRIKWNFVWAFGYNIAALPVASGMLFPFIHAQLPPVVGGMAMIGSSLLVLTSSLLLRSYKPPLSDQPTESQPLLKQKQAKSYSTFA